MIKVYFEGKEFEVDAPISVEKLIKVLLPEKKAFGIVTDEGKIFDIMTKIEKNVTVKKIITQTDPEFEFMMRHTAAHILAQAVKHIYPKAKLGIGPVIENGFYYDFYFGGENIQEEDLIKIQEEMENIIEQNIPLERIEIESNDRLSKMKEFLEKEGEIFKLELLKEIIKRGEKISFYKQGDFIDLCSGPHLPSTGMVKYFRITHLSGAYWKGISSNPQLIRIYGVAFSTKQKIENYFELLRKAKERDHRKLGKELDLFSFYPEITGSGLALFHPKGALIRKILEEFEYQEHMKRGYEIVWTPHIYKSKIWKISGHYEYYKEHMYLFKIDEEEFGIKPMNCPAHVLIYKSQIRSYKDLPIKYFELATVYRYELSGALHGLLRVRSITQDDAHIFCTYEQLEEEIIKVIEFAMYMMKLFGFEYKFVLSTRPEKYLGTLEMWERATKSLISALEKLNLSYEIAEGEGAFYGPKIDIMIKDALNREWQGPTIQVDFNFPERFDLTYVDKDGSLKRPVMIHRTVLGSIERFLGILIEHFNGRLPLWLSPIQVRILPVTLNREILSYSKEILVQLQQEGIRVEIDESSDTLNKKIMKGQKDRIPYLLIIGNIEVSSKTITYRKGKEGIIKKNIPLNSFIQLLKEEMKKPN